jgi:ABC-2 type transport system ATP-binding protein
LNRASEGLGVAARPSDRERAATAPLLAIAGLARRFRGREVVTRLDLVARPGDRIALWGPNGSGKTTVLRCIAGSLTPTAGTITINGNPAGSLAARRRVGASFSQERSFYLRLSGRNNLLFYARLRYATEAQAQRAVDALQRELELDSILATRADACSAGMLQQLALARALLGEPDVLLLDEPTRSLDREAVERLWAALERRRRTVVLFATHHPDDVDRCDRRIELPT